MKLLSGLKDLLSNVAPALGAALGGPLGGVAMKFIADKFTDGDTGKVEDFILAAAPDTLLQLKLADKEFERQMKQLDVDVFALEVKDRDSARGLAKEKGVAVQATLSGAYTVMYFFTLYAFISGQAHVAEEHVGLVQGLIGALTAVQLQIMNFWFGSSRGSKDKTQALVDAAS